MPAFEHLAGSGYDALMIALLLALAAPLTPEQYLAQIERSFVCPEALPDDESRKAAAELFTRQAIASGQNTIEKITNLRMSMLERHGCTETLKKIAQNSSR